MPPRPSRLTSDGVQPGLGEPLCDRAPRAGRRCPSQPPLATSALVPAPRSSQWCRAGRVGFCFSVFKTEANTLCHENRPHVGQPQRRGRGANASGKHPSPLETLSLGVPLAQKPHQGSASSQLRQRPLHKETGNVSLSSTANTAGRSTLLRPSLVAQRPQEAPRPPCWAGPFGPQGWERAAGGPEAPRGAEGRVSGKSHWTWTKGL